MNKPLLSICIRLNRSGYLKECLESIAVQLTNDNSLNKSVEIVVSDNASTDDTANTVKEFQKKFDNIKYFKNETNLGFDRNMLNVVAKSTGEYCLTLGDDGFASKQHSVDC